MHLLYTALHLLCTCFTLLYTCLTPALHLLYTCFTPDSRLRGRDGVVLGRPRHHLHLLYTCFTLALHLLYTCFLPALHLIQGMASCWDGLDTDGLWTTFSARTYLQPQAPASHLPHTCFAPALHLTYTCLTPAFEPAQTLLCTCLTHMLGTCSRLLHTRLTPGSPPLSTRLAPASHPLHSRLASPREPTCSRRRRHRFPPHARFEPAVPLLSRLPHSCFAPASHSVLHLLSTAPGCHRSSAGLTRAGHLHPVHTCFTPAGSKPRGVAPD